VDAARDNPRARANSGGKSARDPEADDGPRAARDFMLELGGKPVCVDAARDASYTAARGNPRLERQAACRDDVVQSDETRRTADSTRRTLDVRRLTLRGGISTVGQANGVAHDVR
jgi:hypothetical protein